MLAKKLKELEAELSCEQAVLDSVRGERGGLLEDELCMLRTVLALRAWLSNWPA